MNNSFSFIVKDDLQSHFNLCPLVLINNTFLKMFPVLSAFSDLLPSTRTQPSLGVCKACRVAAIAPFSFPILVSVPLCFFIILYGFSTLISLFRELPQSLLIF